MKNGLYLIAIDPKEFNGVCCGNHLPGFEPDPRIFAQLTPLVGMPHPVVTPRKLPDGVRVIEDIEFDAIKRDHHGNRLTYVTAGEFRELKIPEDTHPINRGIKGFVDALPDDWPVVLMWD